jgi:alpha-aminoadipic semialdehyde synthase
VIKGQKANMPMLKELLRKKCQLIDYERVTDDQGRRLIFFGHYAGLAGMIDTLWALGQRLNSEGIENPFSGIHPAHRYPDLADAKRKISAVGDDIKRGGLPDGLAPLVVGFAGYGNVSQGAQEILDLLPLEAIEPGDLSSLEEQKSVSGQALYKVVFREEDMVRHVEGAEGFHLQDYYDHPEKYRSVFQEYLSFLTVLVNGTYWDQRYPRLITKAQLRELYARGSTPRLRVVGDISCDVDGGIEFTVKATDPGNPVFVYNPLDGSIRDGWEGTGPVVLAVYNLPGELPRESSAYFSQILKTFVPEIIRADYTGSLDNCQLPGPIKRAVIAYQGELTPGYRYLEQHVR